MAQASKGRLNYRCPSCFMRDIDIDMFFDEEKKEYYCLRCGFSGGEDKVLQLNDMARYRYNRRDQLYCDALFHRLRRGQRASQVRAP